MNRKKKVKNRKNDEEILKGMKNPKRDEQILKRRKNRKNDEKILKKMTKSLIFKMKPRN